MGVCVGGGSKTGVRKTGKMEPRDMQQRFLFKEQQTEAISGGSGM